MVQVYIDDIAGRWCLVPGRRTATFDGFFAPVDNQPTTNKAKAGQTIPLKWTLDATSFATSWEDYYRYNTESNGGDRGSTRWPRYGTARGRLTRSSSRLVCRLPDTCANATGAVATGT